ncbi:MULTISPECIES: hypothetical protein [Streptomyces]
MTSQQYREAAEELLTDCVPTDSVLRRAAVYARLAQAAATTEAAYRLREMEQAGEARLDAMDEGRWAAEDNH